MTKTLPRLMVLLLSVLALGAAPVQAPTTKDLLIRIARDRDGVDPKVFDQLAAKGDVDSIRALQRGIDYLKEERILADAYRSFRLYADRDGEVVKIAIEFLSGEVDKAKLEALRPVALETLLSFRDEAVRPLERILRRNKDPNLRRIACDALVVWLARQEGGEGIELILQNASLSPAQPVKYLGVTGSEGIRLAKKRHRDVIREALATCTSEPQKEQLANHLLDATTPRMWKLLLVEIYRERPDSETTELLAKLLRDDDASVVLLVLELLMERDDWNDAYGKLSPLLKNSERSVRRAAVAAMGTLLVTDARWRAEAMKLAVHRDPALRMGAAFALARSRTAEAIPLLFGLLEDKDWSVRAEALMHVTELRRKDSVPLLIERLAVENPRLRPDVHSALRILTGFDHGPLPDRWRAWWEGEGEAFALPSYAEAATAEDQRRNAGVVGGTKTDHFYGEQIQSERVCFVLDISGSMELPMGIKDNDASTARPGAPTRMEAAKKELAKVVRVLPDGTLFNIIFFETKVIALNETLVRMSKGMRQKSLRFISDQFAIGSTALYPAIKLAFDDPLVDTIYFLSDGAPTEGEITDIAEIREEVRRWNSARHVRIHGIAVGQDSTLLQWLTKDTGGTYLRRD